MAQRPSLAGREIDKRDRRFARTLERAQRIDLPQVGIKGNSHMMMMDKNNNQVADLIQKWLVDKGLAQ